MGDVEEIGEVLAWLLGVLKDDLTAVVQEETFPRLDGVLLQRSSGLWEA